MFREKVNIKLLEYTLIITDESCIGPALAKAFKYSSIENAKFDQYTRFLNENIVNKTRHLIHSRIYIGIPKEPEVIYLGFTNRIIRIVLTKEGWPKRHFIDTAATERNKKLAYLKKKAKTKESHFICQGTRLIYIYIYIDRERERADKQEYFFSLFTFWMFSTGSDLRSSSKEKFVEDFFFGGGIFLFYFFYKVFKRVYISQKKQRKWNW